MKIKLLRSELWPVFCEPYQDQTHEFEADISEGTWENYQAALAIIMVINDELDQQRIEQQ